MTLFNSQKYRLVDYATNFFLALCAVSFGAMLGLAICKLL